MPQQERRRANRSQSNRLAHIERLLWWRGWVRRKDIVAAFSISELQASHDLREYRTRYPETITYDQNAARYVATEKFKRRESGPPSLEEAEIILAGMPRGPEAGPWVGGVVLPARNAGPEITQAVVRAMLTGQSLNIRYASIHSNTLRWRWITPHALGRDGWRWHVRAYCSDENDFRDFVLGRIAETGEFGPAAAKPEDDLGWSQEETVQVKPHPALGAAQQRALKLDFNFEGGVLHLKGTPALLHYALAALGLSEDGQPPVMRFTTSASNIKKH